MTAPDFSIESFGELCSVLEVDGIDGFESWLEMVHDEIHWNSCETQVEDDRLRVIIFHDGLDDHDFELLFPCRMSDVRSEVARMESLVALHIAASNLWVETFGAPGDDGDGTDEVMKLFGVTDRSTLIEAVSGPWSAFADGPEWGSNGEIIHHWFSRGDRPTVLMGIGGEVVFIEPILRNDEGGLVVEEWPTPVTVSLPAAHAAGFDMAETEFLSRLSDDIVRAHTIAEGLSPKPTPAIGEDRE